MSHPVVPADKGKLPIPGGAVAPRPETDDNPRGDIRVGLIALLLFFGLFLGWAAFARLDAAAYATGELVVSGQRKPVQHRDGGVVSALYVTEGQDVRKGDILVRLNAAEVAATERSLTAQEIGLLAQRARLVAEQAGASDLVAPAEFARLAPEDRPIAAAALQLQRAQLRTRASMLASTQAVLGQQAAQAVQEAEGARRQMQAASEQQRLLDEELAALAPVAEKGFVSKNRLRALERARADLVGQGGAYAASAARSSAAVAQGQMQAAQALSAHYDRVAEELRDVEAALRDVQPKARAARERLARTEIRAPVSGTVVGLALAGPSEVIQPGQKLMDVVPRAAPLVIEAQVDPADADDLSVGQDTQVRFSALQDRTLPALRGEVTKLSADRLEDERSGAAFFRAEVTVPADQIALIRERRGADFELRPGMPVEVLVPLRKRTALEYFFEPLQGAFWKSFREH
ncbi:HlyD family type I secretion periplasmic adaptor subunit [Sphingomicrobium astaxanthinifaciens]|uniref:HlyD family type I secretion periplasmic adaptor subunit n=1 Tax=Sphingomicrobium astaxanthinifaciens TaxID=1227949 RepID=UPI001FCC3764|nr:HlyD family type I secretion periplasmic adaptor subunit [Sphingomicrobium astaxanthinifaciens]MCJ7420205.1 HlyD family type I secretion periplasmic adaptor subunit [Sphingomicrobium astaxanthinifaciens]